MRSSRRLAFVLAAGGGLVVGALTFVAWFHRTATERGTGEPAGPPLDLTLWDAHENLAVAVVVVAAVVVVLSLLRVGPWLVSTAGVVLIALLGWAAASLLGTSSPACCETIRFSTSPLIPFAVGGVAAISVLVGGMWAAESD